MDKNTIAVFEAAIAFCNALIQHGESVPSVWDNWLLFKENAQLEAHRGHSEKLESHLEQLQAALNAQLQEA